MPKDKWVKDVCPFAKDQGFDSVIGDVAPGETVFGFSVTMTGASQAITFSTATATEQKAGLGNKGQRVISQMEDVLYRVYVTQASASTGASEGNATYVTTKTVSGFTLYADNGQVYDVIVIGRIKG